MSRASAVLRAVLYGERDRRARQRGQGERKTKRADLERWGRELRLWGKREDE